MPVIINAVLFQLGWFACVLGAANQLPLLGIITVMLIVAYHLSRAAQPLQEVKLLALTLLIGFSWDSSLVYAGLLQYDSGILHFSLAPLWIIAMWALFASTLNVSLNWLKQRYLVATLFGLVGGPLAFYGGFKLGAVTFSDTLMAMIVIGVGWALMMPLLMWISQYFNGYKQPAKKLEICDA